MKAKKKSTLREEAIRAVQFWRARCLREKSGDWQKMVAHYDKELKELRE